MKSIHITDELEHFLHEMVLSGRYASEESVINDALDRLRREIDPADTTTTETAVRPGSGTPLTKQRFQRHLVEIGLLDQPGDDPGAGDKTDASLIDDQGEVLSEMLIRERLIEWLTGFLEK